MSFDHCGKRYDTLEDAARAFASNVNTDADLCEIESFAAQERRGEVPLGGEPGVAFWSQDTRDLALDLDATYWADPANHEGLRIPTKDGKPAVDEQTWRDLRIDAVEARITKARKEGLPS